MHSKIRLNGVRYNIQYNTILYIIGQESGLDAPSLFVPFLLLEQKVWVKKPKFCCSPPNLTQLLFSRVLLPCQAAVDQLEQVSVQISARVSQSQRQGLFYHTEPSPVSKPGR